MRKMCQMNMKKLTGFVSVLAVLCVTSVSSAGVLVTNYSSNGYTQGINNFHNQLSAIFGGNVEVFTGDLAISGPGALRFYYHGAESGYTNSFSIDGVVVKTEAGEMGIFSTPVYIGSMSATGSQVLGQDPGEVSGRLKFTTNGNPAEGAENAGLGQIGFGIFGVRIGNTVKFVANDGRMYFGYDDNSRNQHDNHDDMIVSAQFVPEPMSLVAWSVLGLIGLSLIRRRQK